MLQQIKEHISDLEDLAQDLVNEDRFDMAAFVMGRIDIEKARLNLVIKWGMPCAAGL